MLIYMASPCRDISFLRAEVMFNSSYSPQMQTFQL